MNESHYPIKQAIIFNESLRDSKGNKLPKGKIAAQVAHASMAVFSLRMFLDPKIHSDKTVYYECDFTRDMMDWMDGDFAKVVLKCSSEKELEELYAQAMDAELPCSIIHDNGTTCFDNKVTLTCIAIGPAKSEEIDKITGHLSLLT
jgi:PTH2 family peptidyl-tRNA hydrolase